MNNILASFVLMTATSTALAQSSLVQDADETLEGAAQGLLASMTPRAAACLGGVNCATPAVTGPVALQLPARIASLGMLGTRSTRGDGMIFVTFPEGNEVLRFDRNGRYLGVFARGHGLKDPSAFAFGPDGKLYVSSRANASVLRFDGVTGAFVDVFVKPASGGMARPDSIHFSHNGTLYVGSARQRALYRFDGHNGAFLAVDR